jgi:uncharacterized paraquat-inducible protein A
VYPLALLVAFFSGAWPYLKLLAMLAMWLSPSAAVTLLRRGWVLKWLDVLGKWSLIDAYVMVRRGWLNVGVDTDVQCVFDPRLFVVCV